MKQKRIAECKCNSLAPYSGKEVNGKIEYLTPIFSIIYGFTGISIKHVSGEEVAE